MKGVEWKPRPLLGGGEKASPSGEESPLVAPGCKLNTISGVSTSDGVAEDCEYP
jgi:hypothetical protein